MKRTVTSALFALVLFSFPFAAISGTVENFNSRKGVPVQEVKGFLQNQCWFFSGFDINSNGWNPGIEGDGAMVSQSLNEHSGIYTPLLETGTQVPLSFSYKFRKPVSGNCCFRIYITDGNNKNMELIDSISLSGSNAFLVYHYSKSLAIKTGTYKLFIQYQSADASQTVAIDQLNVAASTYYHNICNEAPIVKNDEFAGTLPGTTSGNVLLNDADPDHEKLTSYLMNDSPDGTVALQPDGSFSFVPKKDFHGKQTHFVYKTCDDGYPALCSINATATIRFPENHFLKSQLLSFTASYQQQTVMLNWNTAPGKNGNELFDVERSLDGSHFETMGSVSMQAATGGPFVFRDKIQAGTARNHDLYYRLKQSSPDGEIQYSKVLILRAYNSRNLTAMSVTPDPEVNDILVNVQLKENAMVVMKINDEKGEPVIRKAVKSAFGDHSFNLEGSHNLEPGNYSLEIIVNSSERMTMKLVKI